MKKILVFSGSNSSNSINKSLVKSISDQITEADVSFIDLADFEAPMYDIDLENEQGIPDTMKALSQLFTEHDAYIIASPEYNGFMPAYLKSALDWISRLSRPLFQNKPLFLVSTSPGARGGATNLKYMADAFQHRGGSDIFSFSLPSFNDNFDSAAAEIKNPESAEELSQKLKAFLTAVGA